MRAKSKQGHARHEQKHEVTVDARPPKRANEWGHGAATPENSEAERGESPTMPSPGDILLGKYCVERVLGQGGMGTVVAARHIELGELYAIKIMLPDIMDKHDAVNRFLREARASARLKSDHVARVHDISRPDDGLLFMVMEYLEGTDLKTHLASHGRLPAKEAITYVLQACEAIAEAHEKEIVHRDIKPANLFLTRKPKTGAPIVKVLDFGISKQLNPAPGSDLTKTGAMLGSPLYMSPEQMTHARNVDARTDIWSLGVVLYELVTGKVPFEGETLTQVVHSVMNVAPKPIRAHVPDVSPSLEAVIQHCLAKNIEGRYPNVEALQKALEQVLAGAFVEESFEDTSRAGLSQPDDKTQGNEVRASAATSQNDSENRPPTKRTRAAVAAVISVVTVLLGAGTYVSMRSPSHTETNSNDLSARAESVDTVPVEQPRAPVGSALAEPVVTAQEASAAALPSASAKAASNLHGATFASSTTTARTGAPKGSTKSVDDAAPSASAAPKAENSTVAPAPTDGGARKWRKGPL
ncbi:MAG: serine/threonine protein kinase [Polyangiaceae bacterium]|nr:serine/threonine protein kinase [Polyangiaceae bacterium]